MMPTEASDKADIEKTTAEMVAEIHEYLGMMDYYSLGCVTRFCKLLLDKKLLDIYDDI